MQISILSGSSRLNNKTMRLAKAIRRLIPEAEIVDFAEYDIPFPNKGGVDSTNLTPFQSNLLNAFEQSHLVFVLTPEYNWFPSAELVNMIHQLATREHIHVFNNKVFAFCGVSSGAGGRIPTIHLDNIFGKILNVFNIDSVTSPKKFEARFIAEALDENGYSLGNHEFDKGLEDFVRYSLKVADRWH
ncbi:MAG: NAD(P)H-dependent oxidoreductase [Bacteroidia bacterium]